MKIFNLLLFLFISITTLNSVKNHAHGNNLFFENVHYQIDIMSRSFFKVKNDPTSTNKSITSKKDENLKNDNNLKMPSLIFAIFMGLIIVAALITFVYALKIKVFNHC